MSPHPSELDADRLDYVARDPKSSGLETGVFDLNRIVDSFTLAESNGNFLAVPSARALTAIEAFFHQRYLNYKALIYHKSALRSKAVLRQAVMRIISLAVLCPNNSITRLCEAYGIVSCNIEVEVAEVLPFSSVNLEQFDDGRLRSFFFDVLNTIKSGKASAGLNAPSKQILQSIELLLETFLFREKLNLFSLDYPYARFSSELTHFPSTQVKECVNAISLEAQKKFGSQVITLFSSREPKVYNASMDDSSVLMIWKSGGLVPVELVSPYLKFQNQMVKEEARFIVGFCAKNVRLQKDEMTSLAEIARRNIDELLAEQLTFEAKRNADMQVGTLIGSEGIQDLNHSSQSLAK